MKKRFYIAVLFASLAAIAGSYSAYAGDAPAASDVTKKVTTDTTGPAISPDNKVISDTAQPVVTLLNDTAAPADLFGDDSAGDPAKGSGLVVRAPLEENHEDIPAGELYEDFDTTLVHAEKFDALTFNDTVRILLKDPGHCDYVHPFNGNVTSTFAFRSYRYHFGVDINLETGDSVRCAFDGKVRIAQRSKTYGYVVVVRHNNGLETYYAHLSKLCVRPGDDVEAGMLLGLGGNTGHSFGSHLHFEVRFRGQPIDPNYLIDFKNQRVRCDEYLLTKSDFKYLATTYKVRHYSRKKKKTWYTYYTPGGAHYATPEAKRIMAAVPDPIMPTGGTTSCSAPVNPPVKVTTAQQQQAATNTAKKPAPPTASAKTPGTKPSAQKPAPNSSTTANSGGSTYTVKKGDTLSAIAARNGTTVDKLCKLNGIKATSTLQIGQKIRVK